MIRSSMRAQDVPAVGAVASSSLAQKICIGPGHGGADPVGAGNWSAILVHSTVARVYRANHPTGSNRNGWPPVSYRPIANSAAALKASGNRTAGDSGGNSRPSRPVLASYGARRSDLKPIPETADPASGA